MKPLLLAFAIIFCIANVNGRNLYDSEEIAGNAEEDTLKSKRPISDQRRRRRWSSHQSNYGYDGYHHNYRHSDNEYSHVLSLLEEIASNLRTPPPPPQYQPPQIIYVPYPVPYPVPKYIKVKSKNCNGTTTFDNRFSFIEDINQLWQNSIEEMPEESDDDGVRPISFDPVLPKNPGKESPPVEHGSNQAGLDASTAAPVTKPGACKAAILTCCYNQNESEKMDCFVNNGCPSVYANGKACNPQVIKRVIEEFAKAYAPRSNF